MLRKVAFIIAALALLAAVPAHAEFKLKRWYCGGGGGARAGEEYGVRDSAGQPLIGIAADPAHVAKGGFWYCAGSGSVVGVIEIPEAPKRTYLSQSYPNPFNPTTRIEFGLKQATRVSLRIYDAAGRLVRVLADEERPAGVYAEIWDGRDRRGAAVASGVYFYRLEAGAFAQTKKMVLLR